MYYASRNGKLLKAQFFFAPVAADSLQHCTLPCPYVGEYAPLVS